MATKKAVEGESRDLTVRLPIRQYKRLKEEAIDQRIHASEIIQKALDSLWATPKPVPVALAPKVAKPISSVATGTPSTLSEAFKAACKGMSGQKVATLLSSEGYPVKQQTISNWLRGKAPIPQAAIPALIQVFPELQSATLPNTH